METEIFTLGFSKPVFLLGRYSSFLVKIELTAYKGNVSTGFTLKAGILRLFPA